MATLDSSTVARDTREILDRAGLKQGEDYRSIRVDPVSDVHSWSQFSAHVKILGIDGLKREARVIEALRDYEQKHNLFCGSTSEGGGFSTYSLSIRSAFRSAVDQIKAT